MVGAYAASPLAGLRAAGALCTVLLSAVMLALSLADAGRDKRWGWLMGMLLLLAGMIAWFEAYYQIGVKSTLPEGGLLLSFVLAATALIYALWVGPQRGQGKPIPKSPTLTANR
jgi:hypothetical protein